MARERAVVLLSGGLDSATAAAWAQREGYEVLGLTVRYGQRHAVEVRFARELARLLGFAEHRIVSAPLDAFGGSALTDPAQPVPEREPDPEAGVPPTYVPARNLVLTALAAAYAEARGATTIVLGANVVDYSGYPDCRRPFFDALEQALTVGTRLGAELGRRWRILTPLVELTKAEIIRMGLELGVPYAWTTSCYQPDADGRPCRRCESCRIRAAGFAAAGAPDPLLERLGLA